MKFVISIIAIAILSFVVGLYAPWWTIAFIAFLVSVLLPQSPRSSFISGFLAIFVLWTLLATLINTANAGILAGRIGELFGIGKYPSALIVITGVVGGFVAGLASLTASYLRRK